MSLQPHQQRVVTEKDELDEKIVKLNAFLNGSFFSTLDSSEQEHLKLQAHYMSEYSDVLGARIAAFK